MIVRCMFDGNDIRTTDYIVKFDKDALNQIVSKAGEHCAYIPSNLLKSLHLE